MQVPLHRLPEGSVAVANAKSFSATERNESFSFHSRGEFSSDFCFSVFDGNCVATFACSSCFDDRMTHVWFVSIINVVIIDGRSSGDSSG